MSTNDTAPQSTGTTASHAPDARMGKTRFSARLLAGLGDPFFSGMTGDGRNVFQSVVFLGALEKHVLAGGESLALVGVADGAGKALAVLPFVRRRKFGVAYIEGVDFGLVDYFAPCFSGDAPLSAVETAGLWRAAVRAVPGVHAVAFKKLPRLLHGRPHALSGADFLKPMGANATTLMMHDAAGAARVFPDKMSLAREVRRKSKKLEQVGALSFDEAATNAEVDAAMQHLVAFRTARFSELGRRDALLDPHVVAFYRALADRDCERPCGRLFTLRAGEHAVAVIYGFAYADVFTLIAPAMTTCKQTQAGSPGLVALFKALEWCKAQNFAVFDLSVGSLFYKSRFDAETVELFEYQQALTPLGLPIVAEHALRRRVRHLALTHPEVRTRLEGLAARRGRKTEERDND